MQYIVILYKLRPIYTKDNSYNIKSKKSRPGSLTVNRKAMFTCSLGSERFVFEKLIHLFVIDALNLIKITGKAFIMFF